MTSNYPASSISSRLLGQVLVNNQQRSPLGAGWTLDGLERLHVQDGVVMATRGDGSALVFDVIPDVFLLDTFEGGALDSWSDRTTASLPAFTEFLGRFGNQTISVTLDNLPPHTGIELHFDFYAIDSWDGTDATYGGPDEFLVGHGTSVDNLFIEDFVFPGRGRPDQSYTTTEPEISGRLGFAGFSDAIYRDLNNGFTFPHQGASVTLNFTGRGLQALTDESWGIDNVTITLAGVSLGPPTFRSPPGAFSRLVQHDDGTFTRTLRDGTRIGFDSQGFQTSVVDRNGNTTEYVYDGQGRLVSITDPVGLVTRFTYDSHLTSITDPAGRTTRFEHDGGGNLVRITDPDGTSRQFAYDSRHRVVSQTDKRGFVTRYEYDFAGRHVKSVMPNNSTREISPTETMALADLAGGRGTSDSPADVVRPEDAVATFTDGNGNTTSYRTDRFGSAAETTDPLGRRLAAPRDRDGLRGRSVSFNGKVTLATFEDGNLVMEREAVGTPLEREARYEYHPTFNKITRVVDPAGGVTTLDYDALGNLIKWTNALGGQQTFTYDGRGLILTRTDENGNAVRFAYDDRGNPAKVTDALGHVSSFKRDEAGNIIAITEGVASPEERTGTFTHDALNRLLTATDGTKATTQSRYDAAGNLVEIENATGEITSLIYDETDRVISIDDPIEGITQLTFDSNGNQIESVDALGASTRYEYDAADQVVKSIDPLGGELLLKYDAEGNVISFQDARGQTTTFEYDLLNRLVKQTDPLKLSTTFTYDSRDNPLSQTDPKGQVITNTYDELSRLTQIATPDDTITYAYDGVGNLLTGEDTDSSLAFTYDALNRPTIAQTRDVGYQPAATLTNSYDAVGNRRQLGDSEGGLTLFTYDRVSRLTQLITPAGHSIDLSYDPAGRLKQTLFPNEVASDYQYDPQGRLASLSHTGPGDAILASFGYTYNDVGNILSVAEPTRTLEFVYDSLQRMTTGGTAASPETYEYDALGNRTTSSLSINHVYDDANRLLENDDFTYTYDANGNMATKTAKSDGAVTTYTFDAQNQLVMIAFPDGTTASYRYDGLGRRIEKNISGAITRYVYDGPAILLEYTGTNTVVARYSHGDRIDQPLSMERRGEAYFYHADHLGSIRKLTDSSGVVANSYDYDSYGKLESIIEGVANPFTYTGRERDLESGLYFYRARYYDPETGRFISQDPIGFSGRDPNLFRYVRGNPANFIDPFGLFTFDDFLTGAGWALTIVGGALVALPTSAAVTTAGIVTSVGGLVVLGVQGLIGGFE